METNGNSQRVCVIGAGPSGLAAVKAVRDEGLVCTCFEREDDVGGNWYFGRASSSVYRTTHLISSKRLTEFADFPMPADYPPYPSHRQALDYLRAYARKFNLYDDVQFNTTVERVQPGEADGWQITLAGAPAPQRFDYLLIANGHHWSPNRPDYPGEFAGQALHSHDFKDEEIFRGKRVLVVGAGNSGCDIAVEAAQHADAAFLSVRRGYHFLPKFIRGRPIDSAGIRLQRLRLPLWLRRRIAGLLVHWTLGSPERFGLPRPDHELFQTHPIINSQLFYCLGHGKLHVRPDVARLDGDHVEFVDGAREAIDLIVYATGYRVDFPFLDERLLNVRDGLPRLRLHAFHPERGDVAVVGMIQPNGALWPLAELQAKIAAHCIRAQGQGATWDELLARLPDNSPRDISGGIAYIDSPRHRIEVDYFSYRRHLMWILKRLHGSERPLRLKA